MNEHKNIITIEDEIKEFSDKPVKSSVLYKKVKELESNAVPDATEASVGDVLTKGEDGIGWSAPSGGGGGIVIIPLRLDDDTEMLVSTATFEEIKTQMLSGKQVFFEDLTSQEEGETDILRYIVTVCNAKTESEYIIDCMFYGGTTVIGMEFTTDSPNGYPAIED